MKIQMGNATMTRSSLQRASWILVAFVMLGIPTFASPEGLCSKATFVPLDQLVVSSSSGTPAVTIAGGFTDAPEPPGDPDRDPIRGADRALTAYSAISPRESEAVLVIDRPGVLELVGAGILIDLVPGEYPVTGASGESLEEALRFYEICDGIYDAQDDLCTCASEIELDSVTYGKLRGLPDTGVFAFTLTQRQTILLETVGPIEIFELFDGSGSLLAANDDGARSQNLQLVATLDGGRYFLRIGGAMASPSGYAVLASVADAP